MTDKFDAIKKKALQMNEGTRTAVLLTMSHEGGCSLEYTGQIGDLCMLKVVLDRIINRDIERMEERAK